LLFMLSKIIVRARELCGTLLHRPLLLLKQAAPSLKMYSSGAGLRLVSVCYYLFSLVVSENLDISNKWTPDGVWRLTRAPPCSIVQVWPAWLRRQTGHQCLSTLN